MLDEKIFDTILKLAKKGISTEVSYNDDRDTYRFTFSKDFGGIYGKCLMNKWEFTPQFYTDAVASHLFIIEKLKKMGIDFDKKGNARD